MNITMKIMPPIFEENAGYGNSRSVFSVKEECKKATLLRIHVRGLSFDESKQLVHEIRQSLYRPSGYIGLQCLSEEKWGHPAEYDKEKKIYEDCIIIPKDFDNLKEQIRAVLECTADKIYNIKKRYNTRYGKERKKLA